MFDTVQIIVLHYRRQYVPVKIFEKLATMLEVDVTHMIRWTRLPAFQVHDYHVVFCCLLALY